MPEKKIKERNSEIFLTTIDGYDIFSDE